MRTAVFLLLVSTTWTWAQKVSPEKRYPNFAFGPTGIEVSIEKGLEVTVQAVLPDSPAAKSKLKKGDVLLSAAGQSLKVEDPRVPLGRAIGLAEAEDGVITLELKGGNRASVKIPALGAYVTTWPERCGKSRAIVAKTAEYLAASQGENGSYTLERRSMGNNLQGCLASLFLLSTGKDGYLKNVERHVLPLAKLAENRKNAGGHINWQLGYQGILLSEYYLRTGDKRVLAGLQELCKWCVDNQAAGGWGHGAPVGPGYVQSGLMNHAGIPILITLILAQECGVKVNEEAYARAVALMYRMSGHGCIAYGDHRGELWWSNTNGRNGMVACAFSLLNDIPRFRKASEHLAMLVADSYYQPEFGHTGGGFNVMWRGMASVHVPKERISHYRRQMKTLAWYYDLCRQPGGGFSMLPTPPDNSRYSGLNWGTGAVGLTYTAPLRTLRITGGPRTKHSVKAKPPAMTWGTVADLAFFGTKGAEGFEKEVAPPHDVYALLLKDRRDEVTVDLCAKHLGHYSPLVRTWAARRLSEFNNELAITALAAAIQHGDPRVRRAVYDGLSGYDNWRRPMSGRIEPRVVSEKFLPAILQTLRDPKSAWWEIDGALFALGRAEPTDIRAQLPLILKFAQHKDWYLREGAFWALVGLHKTMTGEEFNLMAKIYRESKHVYERSSYDAGFRMILKSDKVAFDRMAMAKAVGQLSVTTHKPEVVLGYGTGGIHEAAHRTMMVLKHFDPEVYQLMVADFEAYLKLWEPYFQHSVWLITGSKWQPGILKVLEGLGPEAKPVVAQLKAILARYDGFDRRRIGGAGKEMEEQIGEAIRKWEGKHGQAR